MFDFDTELQRLAKDIPADMLAALNVEEVAMGCVPYEALDLVELPVTVTYAPGIYAPARTTGHPDNRHPDESEAPEIESVVIRDRDEEVEFSEEERRALVYKAEQHLDGLRDDCR